MNTEKKLDKDRFRKNLGNLIEAYQDVARKTGYSYMNNLMLTTKISKPKAVKNKKNK